MRTLRLAVLAVLVSTFGSSALPAQQAPEQQPVFKPGDNLVTQGIPAIPMSIVNSVARYNDFRSAAVLDWHPQRREMLVSTRFGDVPQVHTVKMPGGARTQLTFFPDRVSGARWQPVKGEYFLFSKDIGGGEWFQIFRHDMATGENTLLTDGKSRNTGLVQANAGDMIVYGSTRRNGQDNDIWIEDARDAKSARMLMQNQGGGWGVDDFSPDDKQISVEEYVSANESYIYVVDATTGAKKLVTPKSEGAAEKVSYSGGYFSADGKGLWTTSDAGNEFHRLTYLDLATGKATYYTTDIPWDVDDLTISHDRSKIAFYTNEDGISKLYVFDTKRKQRKPLQVPLGVIGGIRFHDNGRDLAFTLSSAKSNSDAYSVDVTTGRVERWTESELGGLNPADFSAPELVKWKTFDGKMISGFLYRPPARFTGKRPVIINIHGGPEGQARPSFLGRNNYYINELGIAMIFPNVRGSTGYGKTFLASDNGFNRDKTYKDIGALLDWIKTQPELDADHIMVVGGSYGGHMTYAVSYLYSDRICCSSALVGITNLVTLLEHTEAYRRDLRRVEYGDERDPKMRQYLDSIAPINHAEQIKKPIFMIVGKNDPRVPYTESIAMLDKIKDSGTPTWYLQANDEGHGYAKKKNQDFQFYATVLFIEKYMLGKDVGAAANSASSGGK